MMTELDISKRNALTNYYSFTEYVKHFDRSDKWESEDECTRGIRLAIGYFMKPCIRKLEVDFDEYVQCLSEDFAHGKLKVAREKLELPPYCSKKAKKYGIEDRKSEAKTIK